MNKIFLEGMHGLGDNLHQRAIVKYLLKRGDCKVTIETPWPQIYWDLDVKTVLSNSKLRIQQKNQRSFHQMKTLSDQERQYLRRTHDYRKIWYYANDVRSEGSILAAMLRSVNIKNFYDFSFKPKTKWVSDAFDILSANRERKPVLFYRPLIERTEWEGCSNRNPEPGQYQELIEHVLMQKDFFVVSIADLKPGVEWISGGKIKADLEFHTGELPFETMSALMYLSGLVFCSPGFALVLAQSMKVPNICIYGGRESSDAYSHANKVTPSLGIDPIKPSMSFNHLEECDKTIDINSAKIRINQFIEKEV